MEHSVWSLIVTFLLKFQSLLEFHKGQSWAPYCFNFIQWPARQYTIQCLPIRGCHCSVLGILGSGRHRYYPNILQEWEKAWDPSDFNPSKVQVVHISRSCRPIKNKYTMHGQALNSIDHARYLDVDISSDLNFSHHVNCIASKGLLTLPPPPSWVWCLSDFPVLWYMPNSSTRGYSCIGFSHVSSPTMHSKFFTQAESESETCWTFQVHVFLLLTVARRCRFCWSFFLNFLSSSGDIYMLKTWPLPCTVVLCVTEVGGGKQSRRCSSGIDKMLDCCVWNIRISAPQLASNRSLSLMDAKILFAWANAF